MVAGSIEPERLVFVDEMGANTSPTSLYAWSRRGERAPCSAPRNWGANVTLLASMTLSGMGPCLAVEGPTTKAVFETYVERVLAPSLREGQLVVMDNLSSHKGPRVRELVEARGCELLYLPAYSPDLNPIEQAFAKLKGLLRKAAERTRDGLWQAIGRIIDLVTPEECRNLFRNAGYAT
jgi:transposase